MKVVRSVGKALCAALLGFAACAAFAQPVWQINSIGEGTGVASIAKPTGTVAGDLLVVGIMFEKGSTETVTPPNDAQNQPPNHWVLIRRTNNSTNAGMETYYKVAGSSEPANYSFSFSQGSKWAIGISRITGADTSNPIDISGGTTGSGLSVTAPSVTTTAANTLVLAFYTNKKASTYTIGTATERYDDPNNAEGLPSNMMATFTQAAAGATGDKTATATDNESWVGQQVAIRPMIGSPPPAPSLVTPADGATLTTATPAFDWTDVTDPDGDTVTYEIQADNSGCSFASPEVNQTGLSASTHTPGSSLADGTYCWRARAVDQNGNAGPWSSTRNVIIDAAIETSETQSPGSCSSLGGTGANWTNPGNAASSDDSLATASVDGTTTDPLQCLSYSFNIPPNATILGIVVNVERRSSSTSDGGTRDNSLFLVKAGASVGANRADTATSYPTTEGVDPHGSSSDLWGTTWTPAEINAADFGTVLTARKSSTNGAAHTASIDHIEITVHYSIPSAVTPGSFNAFETNTAPNAVTGVIRTKIAGAAFSLDLVAITSGAQESGFTGAVTVDLLGNNTLGVSLDANNCPTSSTTLQTVSPDPSITTGRSTVNFAAVADSWRDVRVRVRYPTSSPTVTSCSTDNFALRPNTLANLAASDQDWQTAGLTRTLDDLTITAPGSGGKVHKAGRPFSVRATAQNAAGSPATTTNYAGSPTVEVSACGGAACTGTVGSLSLTNTFSSGLLVTDVASYPDVGAFQLQLVDSDFASVDAADSTGDCSGRYVCSAAVNVGRFVPDHLAIASSSITPRTDIAGCSGSTFTYLGERMDVQMSLEARDFAGVVTSRYAGTLARLDLTSAASYSFGAIDSAAPTLLGGRVSTLPISGSWSGGVASATAPVAIERNAAPPYVDGPFTATKIGIAPVDLDGVALGTLNLDADNSGSNERAQVGANQALRFGRLRLDNAVGSEKLDLRIPIQLQYWNGTSFAKNTDDTCTSLNVANLALSSHLGGITAANMNSGNVSGLATAFSAGYFTLTKPSPTPASPGAVTVTADLSAEAKSYLKGNWGITTYTADPSSRAAFGLYGAQPHNFIYFRENY